MDHSEAHPAEAATRENGDLVKLAQNVFFHLGRSGIEDDRLRIAVDALTTAALSTHQQQGDNTAFYRLMAALELAGNRLHRCVLDHPVGSREFLERSDWTREAREALFAAVASRAPQPDTVTEDK